MEVNQEKQGIEKSSFDPMLASDGFRNTQMKAAIELVQKPSPIPTPSQFNKLNQFRGLDSDAILRETPKNKTLQALEVLHGLGPEAFDLITKARPVPIDLSMLLSRLDHFRGLSYKNVEPFFAFQEGGELAQDPKGPPARAMEDPKSIEAVVAHLASFKKDEQLEVAYAALKNTDGREALLYRLDQLKKGKKEWAAFIDAFQEAANQDPSDKRRETYEAAADWSLQNREYGNLLALAEATGMKPTLLTSSRDALKLLSDLDRDGQTYWARDFLETLKLYGVQIPAAQEKAIRKHALTEKGLREHRKPRHIEYVRTHYVPDEIASFYIDDLVRHGLDLVQQGLEEMNRGHEESDLQLHSRRLGIQVKDLRDAIKRDLVRRRNWMREYMVDAVMSELKHMGIRENIRKEYDQISLPNDTEHEGGVELERMEEFLRWGTKEEIREYLGRAAARFLNTAEWRRQFGGKPWAHIAETASKLWKDEEPNTVLMDHVFDLEHNNGMIFDKRAERSNFSGFEKEVLDKKRDATSLEDLFTLMEEEVSEEGRTALEARRRDWETIAITYNKLRLAYGGPEVSI